MKISSLFVWSLHIKILLYFKYTLVLKSFGGVISSVNLTSFACILPQIRTAFINSGKHLIASLKHYKRISEICPQLILSNLEVCSSMI